MAPTGAYQGIRDKSELSFLWTTSERMFPGSLDCLSEFLEYSIILKFAKPRVGVGADLTCNFSSSTGMIDGPSQ